MRCSLSYTATTAKARPGTALPSASDAARWELLGKPDPKHVSTSYVERHNLTIRMQMRRFTRLTNAHSKKIENQQHAFAIHSVYYNFARIHQTLRVTPAMETGVADHAWTVEDIVRLAD